MKKPILAILVDFLGNFLNSLMVCFEIRLEDIRNLLEILRKLGVTVLLNFLDLLFSPLLIGVIQPLNFQLYNFLDIAPGDSSPDILLQL